MKQPFFRTSILDTDQPFVSESLNVMNNNITGSLPPQIWGFQALEHLSLSTNSLMGSIPAEVGQLTKITELTLHNNVITGSIPSQIGALISAGKLSLVGCNVYSQCLELTSVSAIKEVIDVAENRLSGSLPKELSNLVSLRKYWMVAIRFVTFLSLISVSGSFTVSRNPGVFGSIPAEFRALTSLGTFYSSLVSSRGVNSLINQSN